MIDSDFLPFSFSDVLRICKKLLSVFIQLTEFISFSIQVFLFLCCDNADEIGKSPVLVF